MSKLSKKYSQSSIERTKKLIKSNPKTIKKCNQNDFKRFISTTSVTEYGEIAEKNLYNINFDIISKKEVYDSFYAIYTNLEDNTEDIVKINLRRWEIEESFRIMKTDFKARPAYLKRDDRIKTHFITCFHS